MGISWPLPTDEEAERYYRSRKEPTDLTVWETPREETFVHHQALPRDPGNVTPGPGCGLSSRHHLDSRVPYP